jgi:L-rhamnose mutarotase
MIRRAFTMRLKPDALAEYKFHHDNIWPELVAEIERSGIASITTFQRGLDLFLVSEISDEAAWDRLWNSPTHRRWADVMQPLMHLRDDGIVDAGELTEIFHLTTGADIESNGQAVVAVVIESLGSAPPIIEPSVTEPSIIEMVEFETVLPTEVIVPAEIVAAEMPLETIAVATIELAPASAMMARNRQQARRSKKRPAAKKKSSAKKPAKKGLKRAKPKGRKAKARVAAKAVKKPAIKKSKPKKLPRAAKKKTAGKRR